MLKTAFSVVRVPLENYKKSQLNAFTGSQDKQWITNDIVDAGLDGFTLSCNDESMVTYDAVMEKLDKWADAVHNLQLQDQVML